MHHDHLRRLDNLLRLGTIAEVDYANATARVKAGGITTDFLPWITCRAGDVKTWSPVSVGEQVLILAVSGEFNSGIILAGVYASNAPNQSKDELPSAISHFSYRTISGLFTHRFIRIAIMREHIAGIT